MTQLRRTRVVHVLAMAAVIALASAATAAAGGRSYTVRPTAAGEAAARATVLTTADLGSASDWSGGAIKSDLTPDPTCSDYHHSYAGLVLSGTAATSYKQPGLEVISESEVFQTPKMVALDWRRSIGATHYLDCVRKDLRATVHPNEKFVALRTLHIPRLATYSAAYRVIIDVTGKAGTTRVAFDALLFGQGSTEISVATTMPLASVPTLGPNELVLARALVGRIRT